MQTIETTQVDQYVQTILRDQSMTPAQRAQHAAAAISVHVMQEAVLPLDTPTPVDDERVDAMEARLEHRADVAMDGLMDQSMKAWEWLEKEFPEDVSAQKLSLVSVTPTISLVDDLIEGSLLPDTPDWREPTPEEQAKFDEFWKGDS